MSFSGITGEQRSKEVEALKSFLTYSLIGSLALHIGALSSGIGNFLARVPELEEEPIELAIVEPTTEPEKPVKEVPQEIKKQPEVVQKQPIVTQPVQKVVEPPKTPPVQQQPERVTPVPQKVQPINTPQKEVVTRSEAPVTTSAPVIPSNDNLRQQLSGLRDSTPNPGGNDNPVPANTLSNSGSGVALNTGTGTGRGTGTGTGIGTGTGNQSGNRSPVVTAPTAPTPPKINNSGTGNGRAACRECAAKYPEAARRRGIEGRVEVAVDTDDKGNVTNVRVAKSSGNRDLDEETLRQARNWKLKPASGGRQGVSIATEYAIQGSRRHRQAQEQKKRREAQERSQQTAASNTDSTNTTRRRRRSLAPTITDVPAEKPVQSRVTPQIRRPRVENNAAGSTTQPRTNRTQGTARESLRNIQRERVNSSPKPQATTNRRRRRENTNTSQSQNKLRQSLRQLRSQPPAGTSQE